MQCQGAYYAATAGSAATAAEATAAVSANVAGVANALNVSAAIGSGILPVYIGANGVPVECNKTTDDPNDVVANFRVVGARYANNAGKAGALNISAAVGGSSIPVYFTSDGAPHACGITTRTIGGTSYEFVTLNAIGAYSATRLNTDAGGIGSDGYGQPVYFYNGVPVAIGLENIGGANFVKIAAKLAYQASVALNANAVNGKKIVIGGYGGAADTIYFG
jgi:hypothetical protein